jgi:hypothetical protein
MGLLFTSQLSWIVAHYKFASQAQRALFAIKGYKKQYND